MSAAMDEALANLVDEMQRLCLDTSHGGSSDDLLERIEELQAAGEGVRDAAAPGSTYRGWASLDLEELPGTHPAGG